MGDVDAAQLEIELLDDVKALLDRWQMQYAVDPDGERQQLWLLALEREQIVAVAYREGAVGERLELLPVDADIRALARQTLVWIWKDEELHAEYLRGLLLARPGLMASLVVYGRQLQGALSGWVSATEHHVRAEEGRLRVGAAGLLVAAAGALGRIPPVLQRELHYQTFRRYCVLNVALEATAELAYCRLLELATTEEERDTFGRIRADEARHAAAFRILAGALTDDDHLAPGTSRDSVLEGLSAVSPWFVPASLRGVDSQAKRPRGFGACLPVAIGTGDRDADKRVVLERVLDRADLPSRVGTASTAAIRVSFMLGYHRADRSNVNDPELVELLARYLRGHGVKDVAVLEAPTVYGTHFAHRSVLEVAQYFGFKSDAYRVVDIDEDLRPYAYERGFVQQAISATWLDADLRIVMPKMRTDPTEFAHLSLSTLEGSTGAIGATIYAGRRVDFRSATMMLLDVAPPDFAVIDSWAPVADGPFGVMGCRRPAMVRHIYAGADALAVDEAVLADLGLPDPRLAPIVRRAHHWFGLGRTDAPIVGERPPLGRELRGAHASPLLRLLGLASYPIYVYLSGDGVRFVPAIDTEAFPPTTRAGPVTWAMRLAAQRAFGLRPPRR